VHFGTQRRPVLIVHRGGCHANHDYARPATIAQARSALEPDDTTPCPACRPDRPLRTTAHTDG
jgi:hypothetical protein